MVESAHGNRQALRRISNASLTLVAAVLAVADAVIWATDPVIDTGRLSVSLAVLVPTVGVIAVTVVAWRLRGPVLALEVLIAASLALTAVSFALGTSLAPSLAAVFALGLLTATVLHHESGRQAMTLTAAAALAVAGEALRPQVAAAAYLLLLGMGAFAAAVGVGLYLRWSDWRRAAEARAERTEERLEIARELHDIVGHHLTGIVVQAQAARHVAERRPEAAADALDHIGREGTEALAAMRWMVSALRDRDPLGSGWEDIERLAALATAPGLAVKATIGPAVPPLTPAQAPVAYRVVAESLTNARRHGRDVTEVRVEGAVAGDRLVVTVTDDGTSATTGAAAPGATPGTGLAELQRRVADLGGALTAGPGPDGGWVVRSELPLGATR